MKLKYGDIVTIQTPEFETIKVKVVSYTLSFWKKEIDGYRIQLFDGEILSVYPDNIKPINEETVCT